MIKEAQTIHLFRQEHDDDIADCVRYFNLEPSNAAALGALPQGDHLLKVGTHKEIRVHHRRTPRENQFTATDSAMLLPPTTAERTASDGVSVPAVTSMTGGWAGPTSGPGCSPPGSWPPWPPSPAASVACSWLWHLTLVLTAGVPVAGDRGHAPRAAHRGAVGPARPVPPGRTRSPPWCVFVVLVAGGVAGCACGGRPAPPRRRRRRRRPVGLADRRQARRSAGEIRARDKAAWTRRASVARRAAGRGHRAAGRGRVCCSGTTSDDR